MKDKHRPSGRIEKAGEAISVGEREAVFIASTDTPDRQGDVVEQNWDLRAFRKNPVLLFAHAQSSLPIGRVAKVWTDAGKTYAKAEGLPEGMDETADKVWRFIKGGFLNAVSVGFLPIDPPEERFDKDGRWLGWKFPRNELLELSVVSVPANQEALTVARSMGLSERDVNAIFETKACMPQVSAAKHFAFVQRLRAGNE